MSDEGPHVECRVWDSGMTVLDMAVIRGDVHCIKALREASPASRTNAKEVSLDTCLRELYGEETLERLRRDAEQERLRRGISVSKV